MGLKPEVGATRSFGVFSFEVGSTFFGLNFSWKVTQTDSKSTESKTWSDGFINKKRTMTMKWNFTTTRRFQSHFIWRKFNLISLIQKSSYWNQWVFNVSDVEVQVKVTTTWSHSNKFPTIDFQWLTCHATKWGLCSSNWKKWPFWSKVLGTAVGCCSTVKKNPWSINWWCNCQVLINESIFKVRKFDMIQSNSLQSLEVNTFIQRVLRSWVQVGTTLIRGSNNWSNKYRIANTKST